MLQVCVRWGGRQTFQVPLSVFGIGKLSTSMICMVRVDAHGSEGQWRS